MAWNDSMTAARILIGSQQSRAELPPCGALATAAVIYANSRDVDIFCEQHKYGCLDTTVLNRDLFMTKHLFL